MIVKGTGCQGEP